MIMQIYFISNQFRLFVLVVTRIANSNLQQYLLAKEFSRVILIDEDRLVSRNRELSKIL